MAFNFLKWFDTKKESLSESEKQDAISELLLEMVWIDGDAHETEISHIVHILAVRYHVKDEAIQQKIDSFKDIKQRDIEKLAKKLRHKLPSLERIQMLRDLWAVAIANGVADAYEVSLFHKMASYLGITDKAFLDNCIKVENKW